LARAASIKSFNEWFVVAGAMNTSGKVATRVTGSKSLRGS